MYRNPHLSFLASSEEVFCGFEVFVLRNNVFLETGKNVLLPVAYIIVYHCRLVCPCVQMLARMYV